MAFIRGVRDMTALCLALLGLLSFWGLAPLAHAVNDKGVITIEQDDFRMRLAKDIYYLEDPDGTATLEDIREAAARGAFSRFRNNTLQFGYSKSTYWLKFTVANRLKMRVGESPVDRFYLSVRYPLLDDVRFYSVHASPYGTRINEQTLGDMKAFSERVFRTSDLVFPFALTPGAQAEIFLKVSSTSSLSLPIYLEPERAFMGTRFNLDIVDGIYLGVSLGLCLYNFFLWLKVRERSYLLYVGFVAVYLTFNSTLSGHMFRFWPEAIAFQQLAVYFFSMASAMAVALFAMEFLQSRKFMPRLHNALRLYVVVSVIGMLATFFVSTQLSARINMAMTVVGAILFFAAALVRMGQGYRPATYYFIGQGAVFLGVTFTVLTSANVLPYYYLAPDVLKWAGAFELLFFSIGLADLINMLKSQQARAIAEGEVAKAESRARETYIEQLDQTNRELNEALKARSEFLANMSHEIRTPMNGVLGMLELVDDSNLHTAQKQQLEIARRSGQTLLALINDILDLSKIESGKMELERQPFNLQDFLEDLRQLYGKQLRDKGLTMTLEVDPAIPAWIEGDRTRLWQVLTNLVSNAIKFTREGGVTLKLLRQSHESAAQIEIQVCDTGIGIPPEAQGKIFESFSQADGSTTRKFGGTGLGLTIAQNLVRLMGGQIAVTSEVGKGSVFAFRMPLHVAALQSAEPVKTHASDATNVLTHLRVLLVEDNAVNRQVAVGMLKSIGVTDVTVAEHGADAVAAVQNNVFDVVLMDVQMPVMDGYEATRRIRALEDAERASVEVIALTASASSEERHHCEEAGMSGFLSKPMQREPLRDALCRYVVAATSITSSDSTSPTTPTESLRCSAG